MLHLVILIGGSIEASPPSDSVTGITVDIFLDPVGGHRLLSSWDQIYCGPYQVWGGTIPQTSINPKTIEVHVICKFQCLPHVHVHVQVM